MKFDYKYLRRVLTGFGNLLIALAKARPDRDYSADVARLERAEFEVDELERLEDLADESDAKAVDDEKRLIAFMAETYDRQ